MRWRDIFCENFVYPVAGAIAMVVGLAMMAFLFDTHFYHPIVIGGLFLFHELGHMIVAKAVGVSQEWHFSLGRLWFIPIPRGVCYYGEMNTAQALFIGMAGFCTEFICAWTLIPIIAAVFADWELLLYVWDLFAYGDTWILREFGEIMSTGRTIPLAFACLHLILYPFYAGEFNDFKMIFQHIDKE